MTSESFESKIATRIIILLLNIVFIALDQRS